MSLSPLVSFKSRYVTYLLNFPRSKSRNSNCQCTLFSKKNPIIRTFCISVWLPVPINTDGWSSTLCVN